MASNHLHYPATLARSIREPASHPSKPHPWAPVTRHLSERCQGRVGTAPKYMRIYRETGLLASAAGSIGDSIGAIRLPGACLTNRTSLITTKPKRVWCPS